MNLEKLVFSLERFGSVLPELVRGVSIDDGRWKPADCGWSLLEIVCHLADEEELDFRERVRRTVSNPEEPWPAIAPEGWAVERRYNERSMGKSVSKFQSLRAESIVWLRSLDGVDWNRAYDHPKFGQFRAGDILAAWVAHDHLHLRQIAKRMYQLTTRDAGEYSTRYAGEWRE